MIFVSIVINALPSIENLGKIKSACVCVPTGVVNATSQTIYDVVWCFHALVPVFLFWFRVGEKKGSNSSFSDEGVIYCCEQVQI